MEVVRESSLVLLQNCGLSFFLCKPHDFSLRDSVNTNICMCIVFVCFVLLLCMFIIEFECVLSLFVCGHHDCRLGHSVKRILTGDRKSLLLTSPIAHYR